MFERPLSQMAMYLVVLASMVTGCRGSVTQTGDEPTSSCTDLPPISFTVEETASVGAESYPVTAVVPLP